MAKIFLAGPIDDPELTCYRFAAAKQQVATYFPDARIFNLAEDLDTPQMWELAAMTGFDLASYTDRERLALAEFMECSHVFFLDGWQQDYFCTDTLHPLAQQLEIQIVRID